MLTSLGALALAGSPVDWRRYDEPYGRAKTALPTYPFQRQRFWPDMLSVTAMPETPSAAHPPLSITAALGRVDWQATSWPPVAERRSGRWLLLADSGGVADVLAQRLRSAGADVTLIRPGGSSGPNGACWHIASGDDAGWRRLLAASAPLAGIVHLWTLDWPADPAADELDRVLASGIEPILAIARQRTGRMTASTAPGAPIWIVTAGAVGPGRRRPSAASLWGLARVQLEECPGLVAGLIDLQARPDAQDTEALMRLLSARPAGHRLAVRDGGCLAERLTRLSAPSAPPILDPNAAYVITGGLGAIGLNVARTLARWGARRLLLLGRRPGETRSLAIVDELRRAGVTIETRTLDIADGRAVADLFAALDAKGWRLAGIIHAAGVLDDGLLVGQTVERVRGVLAPKIAGAINLDHLTRDRSLDFLIMFSSIAAIGGQAGQASYAAANAFLDALAQSRRQQGLPGLSVQWGPWTSGMGARLAPERLTAVGLRALSEEEGTGLLAAALSRSEPTLVAAAADWTRITDMPAGARPVRTDGSAAWLAGLERANAAERHAILSSYVDHVIRGVLLLPEAEPISAQQPLLDFGLDSMGATNLRNRVAAETGVELSLDILLSGASPVEVAEALGERLEFARTNGGPPPTPDDRGAIEEFVL
jgi:short-subunit dehydrogenase/aryl carrier-like protein